LKIAIINPSLIIDYGNPGKGSSQMIGQAMKGMPFYAQGGNGIVSAVDVAKASISLMENKKFEGRYLCVAHNLTFKEIQSSLAQAFGKKAPKWVVSPKLLKAIGKLFYPLEYLGFRLPFTLEISRSAGATAIFSHEHLSSEIGYKFEEYRETCKRIASSFEV
jgi:nucleoside-diphosphate-sugar epimerase